MDLIIRGENTDNQPTKCTYIYLICRYVVQVTVYVLGVVEEKAEAERRGDDDVRTVELAIELDALPHHCDADTEAVIDVARERLLIVLCAKYINGKRRTIDICDRETWQEKRRCFRQV
jgi:hypothetical protein